VLDYEGDLYGERVRVDFVSWLREIRALAVSALVDQIREDVEEARAAVDAATRIA
jgi:riboflavin kinase/FMN adenylyltransferase